MIPPTYRGCTAPRHWPSILLLLTMLLAASMCVPFSYGSDLGDSLRTSAIAADAIADALSVERTASGQKDQQIGTLEAEIARLQAIINEGLPPDPPPPVAPSADFSAVPATAAPGDRVTVSLSSWPTPAYWAWLGPRSAAGVRSLILDGHTDHAGLMHLTVPPSAVGDVLLLVQTAQFAGGPQATRTLTVTTPGNGPGPVVPGVRPTISVDEFYRRAKTKLVEGVTINVTGSKYLTIIGHDYDGLDIRNCTIRYVSNLNGIYIQEVNDFTLDGCTLEMTGTQRPDLERLLVHGIYAVGLKRSKIVNNTFIRSPSFAINLRGGDRAGQNVDDVLIQGNTMVNCSNLFSVGTYSQPQNNVRILNNTASNTGGWSRFAAGVVNQNLKNLPGLLLTNSLIEGNVFDGAVNQYGVQANGDPLLAQPPVVELIRTSNVIVRGNTARNWKSVPKSPYSPDSGGNVSE